MRLLESGSQPASELARELGITRHRLHRWQAEIKTGGNGSFPGLDMRKEHMTAMAPLVGAIARGTVCISGFAGPHLRISWLCCVYVSDVGQRDVRHVSVHLGLDD